MDTGRQERRDRMKKWSREHPEQIKEANRRLYERRRAAGVCVRCGRQDEGTVEGAVRCFACSDRESMRRKKAAKKAAMKGK